MKEQTEMLVKISDTLKDLGNKVTVSDDKITILETAVKEHEKKDSINIMDLIRRTFVFLAGAAVTALIAWLATRIN